MIIPYGHFKRLIYPHGYFESPTYMVNYNLHITGLDLGSTIPNKSPKQPGGASPEYLLFNLPSDIRASVGNAYGKTAGGWTP